MSKIMDEFTVNLKSPTGEKCLTTRKIKEKKKKQRPSYSGKNAPQLPPPHANPPWINILTTFTMLLVQ